MQALRGVRFEIVSYLARAPHFRAAYPFLVKCRHAMRHEAGDIRERVVGPDTELVIDGFQGSANTFLAAAFTYSQPRPVLLAHHLHAPTQIIRAVELGIPTIVTIRDPRSATLSLTSRWPYISISQALSSYIGFYQGLLPYRHGYVLSTFVQTTTRPDEVIHAVNQRFGTDFAVFVPTPENLEAVRPLTPAKKARRAKRQVIRQQKEQAFATPKSRHLLARAEALYETFTRDGAASR